MPEKSVKQIWPPHRKLRKPDAEKNEKTDKKKRATSDQRFAWILTEQKVRSYYRDGHHREAEQHPIKDHWPSPPSGRRSDYTASPSVCVESQSLPIPDSIEVLTPWRVIKDSSEIPNRANRLSAASIRGSRKTRSPWCQGEGRSYPNRPR